MLLYAARHESLPNTRLCALLLCSYPVVAIVMLSDPSGVVGGETAIQRGDGSVLPIAFPTAGSCVVLQASHTL